MNLTIIPMSTRPVTQNKQLHFKATPKRVFQLGEIYDDFFKHSSFEYIGNNSFIVEEFGLKAIMKLMNLTSNIDNIYDMLANANRMKRVVDLLDEIPTMKKSNMGIEHLGINMHSDYFPYKYSKHSQRAEFFNPSFLSRPPFVDYKNQKLSPEMEKEVAKQTNTYIGKFVRFIQMMQEGNVLIRSNTGNSMGDNGIMFTLNKFFNPQADEIAIEKAVREPRQFELDAFINLYKNLTDADKNAMNWTTEFDKGFMQRLSA